MRHFDLAVSVESLQLRMKFPSKISFSLKIRSYLLTQTPTSTP